MIIDKNIMDWQSLDPHYKADPADILVKFLRQQNETALLDLLQILWKG